MNTIFKRVALVGGVLLIVILLLAFTAGVILAQGPMWGNFQNNPGWRPGSGMMGGRGLGFGPGAAITGTVPYGYGRGMMGGRGMGFGPGMMGGRGMGFGPGMMGWQQGLTSTTGLTNTYPYGPGGRMGRGMMGGWGNGYALQGEPITADQAKEAAEQYLAAYNDPNLAIDEVMSFSQNFYVQVKEKDSGLKAFELLVDPYTGFVHPEPGPNMMWNTKYSHMAQWSGLSDQPAAEMSVTPAQAREFAQNFLNTSLPGVTVADEVETFPGYYTIHTLREGQIEGMLSVNGYTGQVWYHQWHGDFLGAAEIH